MCLVVLLNRVLFSSPVFFATPTPSAPDKSMFLYQHLLYLVILYKYTFVVINYVWFRMILYIVNLSRWKSFTVFTHRLVTMKLF